MTMTPVPTIDLHTPTVGVPIPLIGLGTWQADGEECYNGVFHALDVGYRHIDTATAYGNEEQVGRALARSGVDRADVFLTTKLPPDATGKERQTLEQSLRHLGTDHVDLWLIHWPPNGEATPGCWQALRALRDTGKVRAIGVSNYSLAQIDELVAVTGEAPAINQIPWSPPHFDAGLLAGHAERGVLVEGYSPFRRTDLNDPTLVAIAETHGVTVQQVIVAWHLCHQVVVIPKSSRPERIDSNIDVFGFTLTHDQVAQIDALSTTTTGGTV